MGWNSDQSIVIWHKQSSLLITASVVQSTVPPVPETSWPNPLPQPAMTQMAEEPYDGWLICLLVPPVGCAFLGTCALWIVGVAFRLLMVRKSGQENLPVRELMVLVFMIAFPLLVHWLGGLRWLSLLGEVGSVVLLAVNLSRSA